jgi:translocation and assembly module TamB
MDKNNIQVTSARLGLGHSNVEASGTLKDPSGQGALQFKTTLAMGEVGRLFRLPQRPEGIVQMNGNAQLKGTSDYLITGNITGKGLSFTQGGNRISNVNLVSAVSADPRRIDLKGLRLSAFGGEFAGNAAVENMERVHLAGNLQHVDIQSVTRTLKMQNLPYDGVVSGPIEADADLKAPGTTGVRAKVNLAISAGRRGIPVSGRIKAEYNGASDAIVLANSYIALPHTRLNLSGTLGNRMNVQITSGDLNDILAVIPAASRPHIVVRGRASFNGTITGRMTTPRIIGHLVMTNFSIEGRPFDAFAADLDAASSGASVRNGSLTHGLMQASFNGRVGLKNWKPEPYEPVAVTASVRNGDLADIMALAGQKDSQLSGALTADANITGTVGNPQGTANFTVLNGKAYGEPFDTVQAQVNMSDQLLTIPAASIAAGPARLQLNATFRHPRESFTTGVLQAHLTSNQISLAQFHTIQQQRPGLAGTVSVNADVGATLDSVKGQTEFLLTSVNGDASARALQMDGQNYGDFNATARTTGNVVHYQVASDFAGSNIRVNGDTQLVRNYPTNANASISNLPIERVLAAARRQDIRAKGNLSGTASFSGTLDNPQGSANVTIANAVIYDEPLDRVRANVNYLPDAVDIPLLEVAEGPSNITLSARYDHPRDNLQSGHLRFNIGSSDIQLAQIRNIQKARPGLVGLLRVKANGDATVQPKEPRLLFSDLNADVAANGLRAGQKNFGDLTLAAHTTGQTLNFTLDSDLAHAAIHGRGSAILRGDYPVNAQLTFSDVRWTNVEDFLGSHTTSTPPSFDAIAAGQLNLSGPATRTDQLRGTLQLTQLQLNTVPTPGSNQKVIALQNQGPVVLALSASTVRVQSAHLTGPGTDITATGDVALQGQTAMNLTVNANTNLSLLQDLNRNIFSSGTVVLNASVRGTPSAPLVNGRVELKNASFNLIDMPNGISNANGVILLSGNSAMIQSLTGESGGGKVALSGFVTYGSNNLRMGLKADAQRVRVRYPQGTTVVASASVNLTGTRQNSLLSGDVTILRIGFSPQNDFGSMLTSAAPPIQSPSGASPLDNMKLDIHIRTSPAVAVQASLAQNIQADADLRLRGTASVPGMLGRVNITSGNLVFFGTKYTVNQGTVAFYNPFKIQPMLNVDLETTAKGVDVVLTVSGPIDNMKLTYTSDPPLQFQEIVALLATGRTPTSDPTLLANQPTPPPQSFEQMGESAIVSQAIANPVSSRLQRVFGVSQLKIDPTFTSGSELPQARLTLQQQISSNLTFTYVTNLANTNSQIIRVEWAMNEQWSAIATRDENGRFGVDFFYKKQFR